MIFSRIFSRAIWPTAPSRAAFRLSPGPLLAVVFLCAAPLRLPAAASARPNLLFILTEDHGAQLSFIGTPGLQTPHIDSLARSGVYFTHAFVVYPVCSASKAAIYTGLHNHANGIVNNTLNYHKPAAELTAAERAAPLYRGNRIREGTPTFVERLHTAGYYQGVTSKLHVLPNEKFPYDEFLGKGTNAVDVAAFLERASRAGKPWHLFYNVAQSHRPYPNSDERKIRVAPADVKPPAFLPDTPVVRQDWAEYLAAIELADAAVGTALGALRAAGQESNTIVVFLGDHGPTFQHGKMTLYDLGLRTPLIIRAPGLPRGVRTAALASTVDLAPTLLDLLGLAPLPRTHGTSLKAALIGAPTARAREYAFAEISHRGPLPNDGMQERSICDGRWKLIYREKLTSGWRQVQADSKDWKPWRNRTYDETVKARSRFPEQFRILAEMDPQRLGGKLPALELYDLVSDPDELRNLVAHPEHRAEFDRLYAALRQWTTDTADPAINPPATPTALMAQAR